MKIIGLLFYLGYSSAFFFNKLRQPTRLFSDKKYPFSKTYYERFIKRLNSKNSTEQTHEIMSGNDFFSKLFPDNIQQNGTTGRVRIIINKNMLAGFDPENVVPSYNGEEDDDSSDNTNQQYRRTFGFGSGGNDIKNKKSENFEVITKSPLSFNDIGGYDSVKTELAQCIDMLKNHTKYTSFNVRIPKGLIFEGPPGNGKTLLAKGLAGEAGCGFIAVSGSEFQEKYVGVGSSRVRELFKLAKKNIPCIIFIDEIDALGRARGKDSETASSERDNTLNELLVALDGFKNSTGIFLIGATNRADLLDPALLRPGRVDKRVFIGNPDEKTRAAIIKIHSVGKPREQNITDELLVELTAGFSGAQIENILNEAMLNALRYNRYIFNMDDIDVILNKIMVGWQPTEHQFTSDIIDHIAIHEMGHVLVGLLCKHHAKMKKVIINLSAPNSPGYTIFESAVSSIYTREALFEHLMILLAGRIAEEVIYGVSVTTGAINDFQEALKLADKMITFYGMGEQVIYPSNSEKYKEMIDNQISTLIKDAYEYAEYYVKCCHEFIIEGAELLKKNKSISEEELIELMKTNHTVLYEMKLKL